MFRSCLPILTAVVFCTAASVAVEAPADGGAAKLSAAKTKYFSIWLLGQKAARDTFDKREAMAKNFGPKVVEQVKAERAAFEAGDKSAQAPRFPADQKAQLASAWKALNAAYLAALADGKPEERDAVAKEYALMKTEWDAIAANLDGKSSATASASSGGASPLFSNRSAQKRAEAVAAHGGTDASEDAVNAALKWLATHQEADGHWDAKKYSAEQKTDSAVTAFALLAMLAAGSSEQLGTYKDNVRRGVAWLKSKQSAKGLIWDTTDASGHRGEGYPGAITTMAIVEAAAMSRLPDTVAAAQRAVNFCTEIMQATDGKGKLGWRYHPKMEGDTSVTGWYVMALKSAKGAGLNVNPASLDGALRYLDSVEHKDAAGGGSTYWYTVMDAHEPYRLTVIGCLCRQFLGFKPSDLQSSVDGAIAKGGLPRWSGNGQTVDLYYWYYGTLCAFNQGGETWKNWNAALLPALVENQNKTAEAGSWDPVGAYSPEWGRVGQTALATLCLEVYYRYVPAH